MLRLSGYERQLGQIKNSPDDFIVQEICENGTVLELNKTYDSADLGYEDILEGKFVSFVMQKRNWNTAQALVEIAKHCHRGKSSIGFAGTKDHTSTSTQLCSIFGASLDDITRLHIKDISINGAWRSNRAIKMGELIGNSFVIRINGKIDTSIIAKSAEGLGKKFPNYFGLQRFGARGNNAQIGIDIIKGEFESAVMHFLSDITNEKNEDAISARTRLSKELDFKDACEYFPHYLRYERSMLSHLSMFENDFEGALKALPKTLLLMFIHALEAQIFNKEVEEFIREGHINPIKGDLICDLNQRQFYSQQSMRIAHGEEKDSIILANIVGYNTKNITEIESIELERLGIKAGDFIVRHMPHLGCKGDVRPIFAPFSNFKVENNDGSAAMKFMLPAGSYATVLIEEFIDTHQ